MLSQEILWESLHSLNKSQIKYRERLNRSEFIANLLDTLLDRLEVDPFELVIEKLQEHFPGIECFILEITSDHYGKVIKSTQALENNLIWPLLGPLQRGANKQSCIVFNTHLTPVLKTFPPVVNHNITSIIMSTYAFDQKRFMLLISHHEIGYFNHEDQDLLDELSSVLTKQRDRFMFAALISDANVMTSRLHDKCLQDTHYSQSNVTAYHSRVDIINSLKELTLDQRHKTECTPTMVAGTKLSNRYEILSLIGQGGQGCVYHCTDHLLARSVAIKTVNLDDFRPSTPYTDMLIREASLAANIRHPNVVQIFDIGFHSEHQIPFIVMEYLVGMNLCQKLKEGTRFTIDTLLTLFIPVLEALGEAHLSNLVHRDLKLQNLFLVDKGDLKDQLRILDFGIAQLIHSPSEEVSGLSGTLSYLAPEYIKDQLISPQIDVYQVGLVLLELLTGKRIFSNKSYYETMLDIVDGKIPYLDSILDIEMKAILKKATALNPDERYQDGFDFAQELKRLLQNQSHSTTKTHVYPIATDHQTEDGFIDQTLVDIRFSSNDLNDDLE